MNITTNSQLLSSLTSLIDPNLRQQQQRTPSEQAGKTAPNQERQGRINANRIALKDLQARLKADNLAKLAAESPVQNVGNGGKATAAGQSNPNLRENPGSGRPAYRRPGQSIDIKV